jgi:hypothetical protein
MTKRYIKKWKVRSQSNPNKFYTVSLTEKGEYECSCPEWIYRRRKCHHIAIVENNGGEEEPLQIEVVPGNVYEVTVKIENGKKVILYPLLPLERPETLHFAATIAYDLMKAGVSWSQVSKMYGFKCRKEDIINFIEEHGRMIEVKKENQNPWEFHVKIVPV